MQPAFVETAVIDDPQAVDHFLTTLHLSRKGILAVRDAAHVQMMDCSPLMAKNAPGTLAYHYGVLEVRVQFLGDHWEICSDSGIEAILDPERKAKIVFQNVDVACSRSRDPKPRSEKGEGAERDCQANLFQYFGVMAPTQVRVSGHGPAVYFLMVDERGAVEVSRPVIKDKKFIGFIERVFVSDGSDTEEYVSAPIEPLEQPADNFDVSIRRRSK